MKPCVKKIVLAATIIAVLFSFLIYWRNPHLPEEKIDICFLEDACVNAWIMDSALEKRRGLMYVEKIGEYDGALLVFEETGLHSEWMKNMLFPVDFIWLDEDGVIVHIHEGLEPCREGECIIFTTPKPAKYGLEVASGFTIEHGLVEGVKASFDLSSPNL